jgi:hypothetical protein
MSLEQKMEAAIRGAPLAQGLRRELGDVRTLVLTIIAVSAGLLALAATGFGAALELVTIGLLLAGAALAGAQVGRGVRRLVDFYRLAESASSEDDLKSAGLAFADGVAALGIGAFFLLLSFLGARGVRGGAAGAAGATEESAETATRLKAGSDPPPRPNEPLKVTRRIPEKTTGTDPGGRIAGASEQENSVDELLRSEGRDVQPNPLEGQPGAGRQGDRLVDGKLTEIKSVSGVNSPDGDSLSGAVANRVMNARGQAQDIIVDARQQPGMTQEIAERGIRRAYGADNLTGAKIQSIRVIGNDFDITVPRE